MHARHSTQARVVFEFTVNGVTVRTDDTLTGWRSGGVVREWRFLAPGRPDEGARRCNRDVAVLTAWSLAEGDPLWSWSAFSDETPREVGVHVELVRLREEAHREQLRSLFPFGVMDPAPTPRPVVVPPKRLGWVYLIEARTGDGVTLKIGYSSHLPTARLKGLQTGNPATLRLIGKARGRQALERQLHTCWAALRLRGEWFTDAPEIRAWFAIRRGIREALPPGAP